MSIRISYARSEVLTVMLQKAQNYIPQDLNLQISYGHYTALNFATEKRRKLGEPSQDVYLSTLHHRTKFRDITLNGTNITENHTAAMFTVLNMKT
jgi:hypothetical protein